MGNITLQDDDAQQDVYFSGTVATPGNDYTYDALYRLVIAKGRELAGNNGAPTYNDASRIGITPEPISSTDTAAMRPYIEYYTYDEVGNMLQMKHTTTGGTGNWTRDFTIDTASNHTLENSIGSNSPVSETYTYDGLGNIISGFNHLAYSLVYDPSNRLWKHAAGWTNTTIFYYDAQGQRTRKYKIDGTTIHIRKYIGSWEVYEKIVLGTLTIKRETLHAGNVLIDTPIVQPSGGTEVQLVRSQYTNHLGTATLELDDSAAIISYEEYYPYGSTSFQSGRTAAEVSLKRYRYIGKERDEETGFYYMGARYYVPWMARWIAADPINGEWYNITQGNSGRNRKREDVEFSASTYEYCYANPVRFSDPGGEQAAIGYTNTSMKPVRSTGVNPTPAPAQYVEPPDPPPPAASSSRQHIAREAVKQIPAALYEITVKIGEKAKPLADGIKGPGGTFGENGLRKPFDMSQLSFEEYARLKPNANEIINSGNGSIVIDNGLMLFDAGLSAAKVTLVGLRVENQLAKIPAVVSNTTVTSKPGFRYANYGGEFLGDGVRSVEAPLTGSEAQVLLGKALEKKGLLQLPEDFNFRAQWTESGFKYEIRTHPAEARAPVGSNSFNGPTLRVARKVASDPNLPKVQGSGWFEADNFNNWFSVSWMKANPGPANNNVHIPIKRQ